MFAHPIGALAENESDARRLAVRSHLDAGLGSGTRLVEQLADAIGESKEERSAISLRRRASRSPDGGHLCGRLLVQRALPQLDHVEV
jgi:hypothetical protein